MRFLTPAMLTIILLVIVGALVLAYIAKSLFASDEVVEVERRTYPMAIADLEPGTVITRAHLAQGPWPVNQQKPTFARSDSILIGRVVKNKLKAARPIDTLDLYPPGEYPPIEVSAGMQAVSIELSSGADIVDGLVKPGEYVDVHFTPDVVGDERFRGGLTMTLFKGVKVLQMNRTQGGRRSARSLNTVTLELQEGQANILLLAKRRGSINLTYNPNGPGSGGVAVSDEQRAYLDEILGLKPLEEPEKPFVTEIYYGSGRSETAFDKNGRPYGSGYGYSGGRNYGTGTREAPSQQGGFEPPVRGRGLYYRGINLPNNTQEPAPDNEMRLIPSPNGTPSRLPQNRRTNSLGA